MQLFQAALDRFGSQGHINLHIYNVSAITEVVLIFGQSDSGWLGEQLIMARPPSAKRSPINIAKILIEVSAGTNPAIGTGVAVILVITQI